MCLFPDVLPIKFGFIANSELNMPFGLALTDATKASDVKGTFSEAVVQVNLQQL